MKVSFVIPCYRSENTIKIVVDEIIETARKNDIEDYEIVLVNDSSPDQVWNVIKQLAHDNLRIKGISMARNFGQHSALLAGYAQTTGDLIVSLDDDGQTPIDELHLLLAKIEEGYDVVYAYYAEIKQNLFRRFGSFMAQKMGESMISQPKGMKGSSFYVAKRYVIDEMIKYHNPYPYLAGLVFRTTHNVASVMTHHRKRLEGESGYTFKTLLSLWLNGFTAFSVKPLEFGTYMGGIAAIIGFIYALITIVRKLLNPEMAAGWASMISVTLIMSGLILIMLGLIGEYIGRIYISINNAPQYVIKERTFDETK